MLDNLNNEQIKAVQITEGPLLIIAGAGSGKTKVLTTKIAYLIDQELAGAKEILAITFTNKAAREMQQRIKKMIGKKADDMQISTFHSFGVRIIRENYMRLNYGRNFTIFDANDSLTLVKKILKEKNLDPKIHNPKNIKNRISSCKNNLVSVKEFQKYVKGYSDEIVKDVFAKYEEKLHKSNAVDFDDLLLKPIELFKSHPEVLKEYQKLFKYILIDEYQDTNEAQYVLVKKLVNQAQNICVVGDESQSIYGFRGSNYRNILNFENDFPNCQQVLLEKNYRSTQNILNVANQVIKHNKQKKEKNLWTDNKKGAEVVVNVLRNEHEEAEYVAQVIDDLQKKGADLQTIAVLYRTNAQSRIIEETVLRKGIPYRIVGNVHFYGRKEIKDLLAYLRLIYNINDDVSLLRVINEPSRKIGSKSIAELEKRAQEKNIGLFEALATSRELVFKNLILLLKEQSEKMSLTDLVEEVLSKSGMREELLREKTAMAEVRLENLEEFKSITKEFEEKYGIISLEDFLAEISLMTDVVEYEDSVPQITLMTIHAAKGLEFKYVFVTGVEEDILPHRNSLDSADDLEEERRLCYVALTRAQEHLYITYTQMRQIFGRRVIATPSRFINEMALASEKTMIVNEDSNLIDESIEYNIGEKIISERYGQGIIVAVSSDLLTIAFEDEIKKFIKGHKSIKKVKEE